MLFLTSATWGWAETIEQDKLTFNISNGEATVVGYDSTLGNNLVIPNSVQQVPVTDIIEKCFANCLQLKQVALPQGVSVLSKSCFEGCANLENVSFPKKLIDIKEKAFKGCTSLKTITLPDSLTDMRDSCFKACRIDTFNTSVGLEYAGRACFADAKIKNLNIADGTKTINDYWFYRCSYMNLTVPASVTRIEAGAFEDIDSLYITFKGLTPPKMYFPFNYIAPREIVVPFEAIGGYMNELLDNQGEFFTHVIKPEGYERVSVDSLFFFINDKGDAYCTYGDDFSYQIQNYVWMNGDTLTIPGTITYEDKEYKVKGLLPFAFASAKVSAVKIPEGIELLGFLCLMDNTISSLIIPKTVNKIEGDIVAMHRPDYIAVDTLNAFYDARENNMALVETATNKLLTVTDSLKGIPESVTALGDYCFAMKQGLEPLTLPNRITSIGNYCFAFNYDLTKVNLGDSLESIGNHCFTACYEMRSLVMPNSVTQIGRNCFEMDYLLDSIKLSDNLTSLPFECFYSCSSLQHLSLPAGISVIGKYCFDGCDYLQSFTCYATTPPVVNSIFEENSGYFGINWSDAEYIKLYVPEESINLYKESSLWDCFDIEALKTTKNPITLCDREFQSTGLIYDVHGHIVRNPQPNRIYIQNGKKTMRR